MLLKRIIFGLVALTLGLSGAALAADKGMTITAVGGPVAGTSYIGMGAIGKEFTRAYPEAGVTLLPGSDMSNPFRLQNNEVELAAEVISMAMAAKAGTEPFKKAATNIASLANLRTQARLNIVVRADSGITSIEQIRDQKMPIRLAHGPRGSGSEVFGRWVFSEYGIDFKDITKWGGKLYANNFDDAANMTKDGQVDVLFWLGPGEAWFLREMSTSTELRWLSVSPEVVDSLAKKYLMYASTFEPGMYGGMMGEGVTAVATSIQLLVRENMSEDLVYKLTKATCEGRDNIVLACPTWDTFHPETAWKDVAYPLHPGAARYYKEKGYMN